MAYKLDGCTALEANLWGIFHGVSLAWSRGYNNLVIEVDSREAISLLKDCNAENHQWLPAIREILEIGKGIIEIEWTTIGRELNAVADCLAKENNRIRDRFVIFDDILDFLSM